MDFEVFSEFRRLYKNSPTQDGLTRLSIESTVKAYENMGESLRSFIASAMPGNALTLFDALLDSIIDHLKNCLQPGHVEQPVIPMLTSDDVARWKQGIIYKNGQFDVGSRHILAAAAFAAFGYETRMVWGGRNELMHNMQLLPLTFSVELNSYVFWRAIEQRDDRKLDPFGVQELVNELFSEQTKRIESTINRHANITAQLQETANKYRASMDEVVESMNTSFLEAGDQLIGINDDLTAQKLSLDEQKSAIEKISAEVSTTEDRVKAFGKAVREELKVDATKQLWKQRARASTWSFWISAFVIGLAIFVPPYWAFTNIDDVVQALRRIGDAAVQGIPAEATVAQLTAATISRLVIVTAPLAIYFWAIKLIVRFNTRSMILMDDARQRQTTMDTYFHLVENDKASPEERGLMLNALFKPLPGQGQESVEPPNFIELVKNRE